MMSVYCFKQKTAYEMRISDWRSDVCSTDLTTALMMAAYGGSEPVVRFLLESGADATMQNLQKQDAADWARLKKHTSLADKLDELSTSVLAHRAARRQQNSPQGQEIGRASSRERVCQYVSLSVVAVCIQRTHKTRAQAHK